MLILISQMVWGYEVLTNEEVILYWNSLTEQQQIEEIRTLDLIEHSIPIVEIPPLVAILSGPDLYISYQTPEDSPQGLYINIADKLEYSVEMDAVMVDNFIPFNIKPYLITAGIALLTGVIGGLLIP